MSTFEYTAKDTAGNIQTGVYTDIESAKLLRDELAKMGYKLIKAKRQGQQAFKKSKIKSSEIVAFTYEFAGMYSAGLPIAKCLETFEAQAGNAAFLEVIADVRKQVEAGHSLRDSFASHDEVFSEFFLGMVQAGETGGKLSETLHMTASYLEKQADLKSKVKAAFAYPVTVVIMCMLIVTALVIFVVPVFQKLYRQLHMALPVPTQILVFASEAVRNYWWAIVPAIIAIVCGTRYVYGLPEAREKIDEIKLKIPVFGKVYKMIIASRFIRTMAMMLSSGVGVVEAVELSKQVADNSVVKKYATEIQDSLTAGSTLSEPMSNYDIFPPMIKQLASAGEEAGVLPEMLEKGVDFLDVKIERAISSLLVKIEPILSVVLGLVVGMILLGVYLPMFDYMGHIK